MKYKLPQKLKFRLLIFQQCFYDSLNVNQFKGLYKQVFNSARREIVKVDTNALIKYYTKAEKQCVRLRDKYYFNEWLSDPCPKRVPSELIDMIVDFSYYYRYRNTNDLWKVYNGDHTRSAICDYGNTIDTIISRDREACDLLAKILKYTWDDNITDIEEGKVLTARFSTHIVRQVERERWDRLIYEARAVNEQKNKSAS